MIDYYKIQTLVASKLGGVTSTRTTLYQLTGAINDVVEPGEERLIPAVVMNLIESGKIRMLDS